MVIQKRDSWHRRLKGYIYGLGCGPGDGIYHQLTADITATNQLLGRWIVAIIGCLCHYNLLY
jgi:hypothetical protein